MIRPPVSRRMLMLAAMTALLVSCRSSHETRVIVAVDLIARLPRAECRPPGACEVVLGDAPAVRMPSPGRITWTLAVPHEARLRTRVVARGTAPVHFRIGIGDERTYEVLAELTAAPADGGRLFDVDLSAYAGRKWSLFYHPDRIRWRIIFSTDVVHGAAGVGLWEAPHIVTTTEGAREYRTRQGG